MIASFTVPSILALMNGFPEKRQPFRDRKIKKPTDSKIKKLVLEQIAVERKTSALFPSATAPKIVIGFLSSFRIPKKSKGEKEILWAKGMSPRSCWPIGTSSKGIPIGLTRFDPYHWLNSLLQFFFFLPGSWELFSLIPRSFQPLREFADQYLADQQANRPISSADSFALVQSLSSKLSPSILGEKPILYDLLNGWMTEIFPDCPFSLPGEIHPVVLHPEWHVVGDASRVEEGLQKKIAEGPPEILIGFNEDPLPLKRRYYASSQTSAIYDLDAFIETRPDKEEGEHYIAYLKQDGIWYQCDDDRVVQFRSNCLNAPLCRATLLHYKRAELYRS